MSALTYFSSPSLRRPVLLAGFGGWSDAGEAATSAISYLNHQWGGEVFAAIDPEEFYDFQQHRPMVNVDDRGIRQITWPATEFAHATPPGADRDVILLRSHEPSMRWATFTRHILEVAARMDAGLVIGFGALLAGRPHTRPIRVTGSAATPELAERFGLSMPRYEGPTGILGVLMDACRKANLPVVTLWGWVPHYLQGAPSPTATLALLRRAGDLLDLPIELDALENDSRTHDERISEAVETDPDITATVAELERQADLEDETEIPSADELAAQIERYLRDQPN